MALQSGDEGRQSWETWEDRAGRRGKTEVGDVGRQRWETWEDRDGRRGKTEMGDVGIQRWETWEDRDGRRATLTPPSSIETMSPLCGRIVNTLRLLSPSLLRLGRCTADDAGSSMQSVFSAAG